MPISFNLNTPSANPFRSYHYGAFIKTPDQLGMTGNVPQNEWGLDTISTNMGGLISYIELLVTGTSSASKAPSLDGRYRTGQPLGNAYFYDSGFTCKNTDGSLVPISMYINNVPLGNLPFIHGLGTGADMDDFRGLMPSIFEDLNGFNPIQIFDALSISNGENCFRVKLPITNIADNGDEYMHGYAPTEYANANMSESFVKLLDPCLFTIPQPNNKPLFGYSTTEVNHNPASKEACTSNPQDGFANINNNLPVNNLLINKYNNGSEDYLVELYFIAVSILFLFILLKLFSKKY